MLVMRFANRFLAPMWNNQHISNVQVMSNSVVSLHVAPCMYVFVALPWADIQTSLMT